MGTSVEVKVEYIVRIDFTSAERKLIKERLSKWSAQQPEPVAWIGEMIDQRINKAHGNRGCWIRSEGPADFPDAISVIFNSNAVRTLNLKPEQAKKMASEVVAACLHDLKVL